MLLRHRGAQGSRRTQKLLSGAYGSTLRVQDERIHWCSDGPLQERLLPKQARLGSTTKRGKSRHQDPDSRPVATTRTKRVTPPSLGTLITPPEGPTVGHADGRPRAPTGRQAAARRPVRVDVHEVGTGNASLSRERMPAAPHKYVPEEPPSQREEEHRQQPKSCFCASKVARRGRHTRLSLGSQAQGRSSRQ